VVTPDIQKTGQPGASDSDEFIVVIDYAMDCIKVRFQACAAM